MLGNAVAEVLGFELELRGVFVRLVVLGIMNLHFLLALLFLDGIDRRAVVPRVHLLVDELASLALVPYRTVGLIDADDVHVVVQGCSLLSKHLMIGIIEDATGLTGIGSVLCLYRTEGRQKQHQHEYNPYSHLFFSFGVQNYTFLADYYYFCTQINDLLA